MTPADISRWLTERGLTTAQGARELGVARKSLQRWRSGLIAAPPWLAGLLHAHDRGWRAAQPAASGAARNHTIA